MKLFYLQLTTYLPHEEFTDASIDQPVPSYSRTVTRFREKRFQFRSNFYSLDALWYNSFSCMMKQ